MHTRTISRQEISIDAMEAMSTNAHKYLLAKQAFIYKMTILTSRNVRRPASQSFNAGLIPSAELDGMPATIII